MNVLKCKNCNYQFFEEQKFCNYCGTLKNHIPLVDYQALKSELEFKDFFSIYNDARIEHITFIVAALLAFLIAFFGLFLMGNFVFAAVGSFIFLALLMKVRNSSGFGFLRLLFAPFFVVQEAFAYLIKAIHFSGFKKRWSASQMQKTMKIQEKIEELQGQQKPIAQQIGFLGSNASNSLERQDVLQTMQKVNQSIDEKIFDYQQTIDMIHLHFFSNQFAGRIKKIQAIKSQTDYNFEIQEMKKLQKELFEFAKKNNQRNKQTISKQVIERYKKLDQEIRKIIERLENNRALLLLEDVNLLEMKMKQQQFMGDLYNEDYLKNVFEDDMEQILTATDLSTEASARIDAEIEIAKKYLQE